MSWRFFTNKEVEHLDSKSIPIVKAYIGTQMIDMLIRRPQPEEHDSVRAVVQTVVDEIYGRLWGLRRFRLMRRTGIPLGSLFVTPKSSEWFGQAENGWMIYGCFAKTGDMA